MNFQNSRENLDFFDFWLP